MDIFTAILTAVITVIILHCYYGRLIAKVPMIEAASKPFTAPKFVFFDLKLFKAQLEESFERQIRDLEIRLTDLERDRLSRIEARAARLARMEIRPVQTKPPQVSG